MIEENQFENSSNTPFMAANKSSIANIRHKVYKSLESFYENFRVTIQSLMIVLMSSDFYHSLSLKTFNTIIQKELESKPNASIHGVYICLLLIIHIAYTIINVLFFEIFKLFIIWIFAWCLSLIGSTYVIDLIKKFKAD